MVRLEWDSTDKARQCASVQGMQMLQRDSVFSRISRHWLKNDVKYQCDSITLYDKRPGDNYKELILILPIRYEDNQFMD